MNNQNPNYVVSVDRPVFCLMALIIVSAFTMRAIRIIMEPINEAVRHKIENSK